MLMILIVLPACSNRVNDFSKPKYKKGSSRNYRSNGGDPTRPGDARRHNKEMRRYNNATWGTPSR